MDSARPYSLQRRLLLALLTLVAAVWVATAVYSYLDARHELSELLDAHLAQSASLIIAQVGHELEEIDLEHAPKIDKRAHRVAFQIWERGTVLRLHSTDAPDARLAQREEGYSDATIDGKGWRVFSTWDAQRKFLVQLAERDDDRRDITAGIAANLLLPLGVALPVLALFIWLTIGRALEPLHRLGEDVGRRKADNLEPLVPQRAPSEILPLVRGLNALFERVKRLVQSERRFTGDAAHELRTPLAALKIQAQVAEQASHDAARRQALRSVIEGCDRAARLVEQLLTLARLDPGVVRPGERCDLLRLARDAIAEMVPFALARNVEIGLRRFEPIWVEGHADLLSVLLRNLLDNAVRYSRVGSAVTLDIERSGDGARVVVTDAGPGIPPEERTKIGQRFYRVLGTGQSGSGLGLSIVRRIAEIHDAELRFEDGENRTGLRVAVEFLRGAT